MEHITLGPLNPKLPVLEIMSGQGAEKGTGFGEILKEAIAAVNELQKLSDQEIQKLMTGQSQELQTVATALQKADLSFQLMMQVRNQIVQAYQEIMSMQI